MTQLDKNEVLAGLFGVWDEIDELLAGLSDEQWQVPTALPGWRVHDVVSHLIGTESSLLGIPTPEPDCDVSELVHVHNPVGVMNECWVRHLRGETPAAMLERFRAVTAERRKVLADMDDGSWNATMPTPVGQATYGRFMRVRIFDLWMHEQDIRDAVGVWETDDVLLNPPAEQALAEIMSTLGYVVGKLGGAPSGSRIVFALTGPLQRTARVAVNGRAQVFDGFDGEPTATIEVDAVLWTRLLGGRTTAAQNMSAIELSGDVEVARRVVENLRFVM